MRLLRKPCHSHPQRSFLRLVTMSFGFSVSDILTISQLASTIRKQFVDAPDQFKAICDE